VTTEQPGVIELERLSVAFGGRPILRELEASLTGRAIGLLGPNGAGKTTLIHTLLGFHRPSSGTARVLGHDIRSEARSLRHLVGYMPERDAFISGMTGVRFVRYLAELSGLPAQAALERAHEAFVYVGLGEARYRPVESYSLGMKQLVKLAQAIVHAPRLLFLDEPTNGLDPPHRARMLRLIQEIRDSGSTRIVFSSHLLRDVEQCCDQVLVLQEGRVAVSCDLEAERKARHRLLELEVWGSGEEAFVSAARDLGCECGVGEKRTTKMVLPENVAVRDLYRLAATHSVQLRRLHFQRTSLEEIFLRAMGA
jgi:ABC-2 type transport system ATP-binding protein